MQNKPKAVFYCGTNGAGKSTLRSFNRDIVQIVIDSDHIAMEMNPIAPRLADVEAGRKAIELFKFAIEHKISFSMESTLSGKSILQRMQKAKNAGFEVRLNYIGLVHADLNVARVNARVKNGGHFIEPETVRKRFKISRENLISALLIADESFLYDNSFEVPTLMFSIENNVIYLESEERVEWGNNLLVELQTNGFQIQAV